MNLREKILNHAKNDTDRLLMSKILDIANDCVKNYKLTTSQFLNGYEAVVARDVLKQSGVSFGFYGGYDDAERTIAYVYPDYYDPVVADLPISVIKITGRDIDALNHRDYLGSMLALGIRREKIGDISVNDDSAFVVCMSDIADYIISQTRKIGNKGVKLELYDIIRTLPIPPKKFKEIGYTIASLRLDAVVSAVCNVSRSDAAYMIKQESISVNWMPVCETSYQISEADLLSVKGYGRFLLYSVNGLTRKGRTSITVRKYI